MTHKTIPKFWDCMEKLPDRIQDLAKSQFQLLKDNPSHPSLRFGKRLPADVYAARVNDAYRALAVKDNGQYYWFWIGSHREYERLIKNKR